MKLSLSSDYGNPEHWGRLVEFACEHQVDRLVYWGDSCTGRNKFSGFTPPFLYPEYPELNQRIKEPFKEAVCKIRDYFQKAYEMTVKNNMEFWYVFQVLQFPDIGFNSGSHLVNVDLEPLREIYPDLINPDNEVDMSSGFIYEFIEKQIDELFELAPNLTGIELWIMERAVIKISRLKNQRISTDEIIANIVNTIHRHLEPRNCKLDVDLHTSGGETGTLHSLMNAARKHNDIFMSADNTIGDYHLHLPFNKHLKEAAKRNPVIVNFDLNGEYWGKNFVPTSAINQYEAHIEEARKIKAGYLNGRVATENDMRNPHMNILPVRKKYYPALAGLSDNKTLPDDLRISCIDTLNAFNAIYFCLKCKERDTDKEKVIKECMSKELGLAVENSALEKLTSIFLDLEKTLKKIFYIDKNLYHGQSLLCRNLFIPVYAIDTHLTSPEGTLFPTPEALAETGNSVHPVAFKGWPVPEGHICCGPEKIIREKEEALAESSAMLQDIIEISKDIEAEENRDFLRKLFEDMEIFAKAFLALSIAHIHYFLLRDGKKISDDLPDKNQLGSALVFMQEIADEWKVKYPADRYSLYKTLIEWKDIIANSK